LNISESQLRFEIYLHILRQYEVNKASSKYFYVPKLEYLTRLYFIFIPVFLFQTNFIILFALRNEHGLRKYNLVCAYSIFSLYVFFIIVDKKLFLSYIRDPNPYTKYMRDQ
jgi:hypothetical protein